MFLKKNFYLLLTAVLLISFSACQKDEPLPPEELPTYEDGIFITNEGPFQNGSGSISFYSRKTGEISNDIYQNANRGVQLGNIVQSMAIHNDLAYVVVNNANKIIVADARHFWRTFDLENNLKSYILLGRDP